MYLNSIEEAIKSNIDIQKIKSDLIKGFNSLLGQEKNIEVKQEFEKALNKQNYKLEFAGITIHIMNTNRNEPYLRARLNVFKEGNQNNIAWYEIEYGVDGGILDDYFHIN